MTNSWVEPPSRPALETALPALLKQLKLAQFRSQWQAAEQQAEACMEQPDPDACLENLNATSVAGQPTSAPPDPRLREIFLKNDVVRTLIGDGEERQDLRGVERGRHDRRDP